MRTIIAAALLATALVANACAEKPSLAPHAAAVPHDDAPKSLRSQDPIRKPSLPVSISTKLPDHIAAGEALTLDIRIRSALQHGDLAIAFLPGDGLTLVSPQQELLYILGTGGLDTHVPLTVLPMQDGRYSITVDIRISDGGTTQGTARGITFRVGDAPATVQTKVRGGGEDDAGVISLPAQETVTRSPR